MDASGLEKDVPMQFWSGKLPVSIRLLVFLVGFVLNSLIGGRAPAVAQFPSTAEERYESAVNSLGSQQTLRVTDGINAKVAVTLLLASNANCHGFRVVRVSEHGDLQTSTTVEAVAGIGRNMSSIVPKVIDVASFDLDKVFADIPPITNKTPLERRLFVRYKSGAEYVTCTLDRQSLPASVQECLGGLLPMSLWREFGAPVPSVASQLVVRSLESLQLRTHGAFCISPDREQVALVDGRGWLLLARTADSDSAVEIQPRKDLPIESRVINCTFVDNSQLAVVTNSPASVIRFDTAKNEVVARVAVDSAERIDRMWATSGITRFIGSTPGGLIAFSADGKRLALPEEEATGKAWFADPTGKTSLMAAADQSAWVMRAGQMSRRLECEGELRDAMFSPSGDYVALITVKQRVQLSIWNSKTWKKESKLSLYQLSPQGWPVEMSGRVVCWSPDEKFLIAATNTGTFRGGEELQMWDLAEQRHAGRVPGSNKRILPGGGFVNENKLLMYATEDGEIRKLNWPETLRTIRREPTPDR